MTKPSPASLWIPSPKPTTSLIAGEMWRPYLCQNSSTAGSTEGGNPDNTAGSRPRDAVEELQSFGVRTARPAKQQGRWKKLEKVGTTIRALLHSMESCFGHGRDEEPLYEIVYDYAMDDDQCSISSSFASGWSDEEDSDDYAWFYGLERNNP